MKHSITKIKIINAIITVVIMLTSSAFGQWNGTTDIYNTNNGKLGISSSGNFTNPSYQIDCKGDINVNLAASNANAFRIGGSQVLWHNGITSNIYIGVSAGNSYNGGGTNSIANTFVGNNAGNANHNASGNTAIGFEALLSSSDYGWNTAVGYKALWSLNSSCDNCDGHNNLNVAVGYEALKLTQAYGGSVLGFRAGYSNTTGCSLTAIGEQAAYSNTTGNDNTAVGEDALLLNTTGGYSTAIGVGAGVTNVTGSNNTYLGYEADASQDNLTNSSAIGSGAIVSTDNTMILGDNRVYVGIGSSGGPVGMLSIFNTNAYDPSGTGTSYGLNSVNDAGSITNASVAGYFSAYGGALSNTGVSGIAADFIDAQTNIGVYGGACGGVNSTYYGGYFDGQTCDIVADGSTSIGMYCEGLTWAAYVNGDGYIATTWTSSDANLKTNVVDLTDGLQKIMQLQPKEYDYDTTLTNVKLNLPKRHQYGFMAQDLQNALPALVKDFTTPGEKDNKGNVIYTPTSTKAVNYTAIIPMLVSAVQTQQVQIVQQKNTIDSLIVALAGGQLKILNGNGENDPVKVKLQNLAQIILYQNQPNPYTNSTVIRFFIPENVSDVTITFQDNTGKPLKEVKINQSGQGSIEVDGSDLSTGIYTYSLLVAGKIIDTKKMVKN